MSSLTLTAAQQCRLEKLAKDARRTPEAMLRLVLRDGFDLCEFEVYESLGAERDAVKRGYVAQAAARRQAREAIYAAIGNGHRQAA
ncbi:MAG: hypothetical protein ACKVQK_22835 [Burkholderiales bacterium]